MISSNSDFFRDLEEDIVDATEAVGDVLLCSCFWSIFDSKQRIQSSSCCSRSEGAVILEFVGELMADCVCVWFGVIESRRKPAVMSE